MSGIGRGLLSTYVARDNTTVIAAVRDIQKDTSQSLYDLPKGKESKVVLVTIDSLVETDPKKAIDTLQHRHGINRFDLVIANAGDARYFGPVTETPLEEIRYHFDLNTIGPFLLLQATWPLLQKSSVPKFVVISSRLGSVGDMKKYPLPAGPYGASKAAINYLIRKANYENPSLVAFVICPGYVNLVFFYYQIFLLTEVWIDGLRRIWEIREL